jgi:hypothetical protein
VGRSQPVALVPVGDDVWAITADGGALHVTRR